MKNLFHSKIYLQYHPLRSEEAKSNCLQEHYKEICRFVEKKYDTAVIDLLKYEKKCRDTMVREKTLLGRPIPENIKFNRDLKRLMHSTRRFKKAEDERDFTGSMLRQLNLHQYEEIQIPDLDYILLRMEEEVRNRWCNAVILLVLIAGYILIHIS